MNRIPAITPLIVCLFGNPLAAQKNIRIQAAWHKNDTCTLSVINRKEKTGQNQKFSMGTAYTIHVKILDSSAEGYEVQWQYNDPEILSAKPDSITRMISGITQGLTIRFRTSHEGAFEQVDNYNEIVQYLDKRVEALFIEKPATEKDVRQIQAVKDLIKGTYDSREKISELFVHNIRLYYKLYGLALPENKRYAFKGRSANAFGGEPYPTFVTAYLTRSADSKAWQVSMDTKTDQDSARTILQNTIEQLQQKTGAEIDEKILEYSLYISSHALYKFSPAGFKIRNIHFLRTIPMQDEKAVQTETTDIRLVN